MRMTLVMAALAICLLVGAGGTIGAPSPMTWTDVGSRSASSGTFTAAAPLCPSGTVTDIGGLVGIKTRHTCADGSGTFEFESSGGASCMAVLGRRHRPLRDPARERNLSSDRE